MKGLNKRKVVVIGCGFVGSACSFSLLESRLFEEIILIDANKEKAIGEALDISHGVPFVSNTEVRAGDYEDIKDAQIVIITAGANQKQGETRLDLASRNVAIHKSILQEIKSRNYNGILLVVANPVDVLTYLAAKKSGLPSNKVIGSGTLLDTARLKHKLGQHLNVDPKVIDAFIIGEHGDSEIVCWSSADVAGVPIHKFCEYRGYFNHERETSKISKEIRNAAYEIISRKGVTNYGIAKAVVRICKSIIRDEKSILPVSSLICNEYDLNDVCLSVPSIIGSNGIEGRLPISLDEQELVKLTLSSNTIKKTIKDLKIDDEGMCGNK